MTHVGRERRISWSSKTLKNVNGKTVAVLSVGQDITDLNQAQQRALQAERLAGIGQMSTGLAHESRNALQRIQACAEMLELEVEGNAEAMDLVRRIKLAQDHMHRLFDEVRGYAAPVNLDCSDCHLGSIWREAWEILMPQWEERIAELVENTSDVPLRSLATTSGWCSCSASCSKTPWRRAAIRCVSRSPAVPTVLAARTGTPHLRTRQRTRPEPGTARADL